MYRFNGSARRLTLGTYPAVPLADARMKVADAKRKLAHGEDPGIRHLEEIQIERGAPTIETLVEDYLEHYARQRKRSAREDERILRKDVIPAWRGITSLRPIRSCTGMRRWSQTTLTALTLLWARNWVTGCRSLVSPAPNIGEPRTPDPLIKRRWHLEQSDTQKNKQIQCNLFNLL